MVSIVKALISGVSPKAAAVAVASAIAGTTSLPLLAQAQTDTPTESQAPAATRAVEQATSPIGIAAGQALMGEAESAIASEDYTLAASKLVEARKALNDVSTYYQNLSGVFVGVDSRVTSDLRALALESAQVRDQASYQLAVVYRAQSRPDLAVPLLVEVVGSQQPTRALGQQAYQQLYELGFVGIPYDAPSR
ncbi:MAG: hypothetical protein AAFQ40_06205 [Cyanobacteria bacterium J06623_5]